MPENRTPERPTELGRTADDFDLHPGWLSGLRGLSNRALHEMAEVFGAQPCGHDDRLSMMCDSIHDEMYRRRNART